MRRTGWTASIVPNGDDQNNYIVLDDFGRIINAFVGAVVPLVILRFLSGGSQVGGAGADSIGLV
jgi:hypothetical protein